MAKEQKVRPWKVEQLRAARRSYHGPGDRTAGSGMHPAWHSDDGKGFHAEQERGMALLGMQERATTWAVPFR